MFVSAVCRKFDMNKINAKCVKLLPNALTH